MRVVTFALFDDTLFISYKKILKNLFFSWEKSLRTAVIFFMVRSVIKGCFIEWKCLRLSNFNLRLDLIKTSFFKVLTYLNRSSGKFYMVLKKKSAQSVYFYRFYGHFKFCPKDNLHNICLLNIAIKPVKIVRLSWFFFQNYVKFSARSNKMG